MIIELSEDQLKACFGQLNKGDILLVVYEGNTLSEQKNGVLSLMLLFKDIWEYIGVLGRETPVQGLTEQLEIILALLEYTLRVCQDMRIYCSLLLF